MSLLDNAPIPRKTMVLFFVVDTSGSMSGSKIGAVNSAIEDIIPELQNLSESNVDAQIKIAVLEFSSGAKWITPNGPVEVENIVWKDLDADGATDFGAACIQLNDKLSVKTFMNYETYCFKPIIFLLMDGSPTDDYRRSLYLLKRNQWFQQAIKVAVAIGDEADMPVLENFTGSSETVVTVHNSTSLKKFIKFEYLGGMRAYTCNDILKDEITWHISEIERLVSELTQYKNEQDTINEWDNFTTGTASTDGTDVDEW